MMTTVDVQLTVNGEAVQARVEPRTNLVDFLRNELGLTGSHVGCEHGVCGACTIKLDGQVVRGCLTLAVQADGLSVETIEGRAASGAMDDLLQRFVEQRRMKLQGEYTPCYTLVR